MTNHNTQPNRNISETNNIKCINCGKILMTIGDKCKQQYCDDCGNKNKHNIHCNVCNKNPTNITNKGDFVTIVVKK